MPPRPPFADSTAVPLRPLLGLSLGGGRYVDGGYETDGGTFHPHGQGRKRARTRGGHRLS